MKRLLVLPLVCVLVVMAQSQSQREWGPLSGPFRLSISCDKQRYAVGESIGIVSVLLNASDHAVHTLLADRISMFDMQVTLPTASWLPFRYPLPLRESALRIKYPMHSVHALGRTLKPGDEVVDHIELGSLYNMSTPGEYIVMFRCALPPGERLDAVKLSSNELRITVAEGAQ